MVLRIFKQYTDSPPTKGNGPTLPPFRIKKVIINYPLHYPLHQYRQNLGKQ